MVKRKQMSKKLRFEIFKRDGFSCQYCGATPPAVVLEVDHINPVANGGDNDPDNLICACFNCNRGKAANSLDSIPQSLSEKAAITAEAEEQLKGFYKILKKKKERLEDESWEIAEIMKPGCAEKGFNIKWRQSIVMFLQKLDFYAVTDAMEIASAKMPYSNAKTFAYFCGICWNRIKENDCGES